MLKKEEHMTTCFSNSCIVFMKPHIIKHDVVVVIAGLHAASSM